MIEYIEPLLSEGKRDHPTYDRWADKQPSRRSGNVHLAGILQEIALAAERAAARIEIAEHREPMFRFAEELRRSFAELNH